MHPDALQSSLAPGVTSERAAPRPLTLADVYDELFPFVWRVARRMGVADSALDDVCQDTFVVVHRRLAEFEGRSSLRTWVFGILQHVVSGHRRSNARKSPAHRATPGLDLESLAADQPSPLETASGNQAARIADALLDQLDDDKRTVLVLVELEGLAVTEVAEATGTNLNTVYSRLRAARSEFSAAVARFQAADQRRLR